MRVAVTYDNGEIFQHFGHTEEFKVYEIEDGKVASSEVISSNGSGHGALAELLNNYSIDVLICGGIGGGAKMALDECGIKLFAGNSGSADEAVEKLLRGELTNSGVNCNHHDGEHTCGHHDGEHTCGHHDGEHTCGNHDGEHTCGHHGEDENRTADEEMQSGCGSSCGGCGMRPSITGPNVGRTCRTHYRGTFNDGTQFDSSYDRGEPLEFICGAGMMIQGFDAAVANMEVGQIVDVHLMPEEAYGMPNPAAIFTLEIAQLPGSEELEAGDQAYLQNEYGQPIPVKVVAKDDKNITFDANHEMAGKELNFRIELVEVK